MMVPTGEAATFVVVEPKLALEVLVDALGAPALHGEADELREGHVVREAGEEVVGGRGLAGAPLDDEPDGGTLGERAALLGARGDAASSEAGGERLAGAGAPGESGE